MTDSNSHKKIHVAHVLHSFRIGGLENGVVNLINNLPVDSYHHSIVCVTDYCPEFFTRIKTQNCDIYSLNKPPGKGLGWLFRCWKLLRKIRPDVLHSRNLSAFESQLAKFLTGSKLSVHGEHGWDVGDIGGTSTKNQRIKRVLKPLVDRFIALSREGEQYIIEKLGVSSDRVLRICNGVDINRFSPCDVPQHIPGMPESFEQRLIFGTVGRLATVKNQPFLLEGFIKLLQNHPDKKHQLGLIVVGDGPLMASMVEATENAGITESVWFAGSRDDVPVVMSAMSVFVLPSLAEGISNVFLEAMAAGLPVIATSVGGNGDLMMPEHQKTHLIEVDSIAQLVAAMEQYVQNDAKLLSDAKAVRQHCVDNFSIDNMVGKYDSVYQLAVR